MMGLERLSLAFVVVGGCYSPEFPLGSPCSTDSECPSSQRCVAGVCGGSDVAVDAPSGGTDVGGDDAGVDSGTPQSDPDGDGIVGAADNCPNVANADQGNEDGDKFGDVCDPCPIEANDAPSDPDGDGVADGCDPMATTAGNQIVLFEGFHGVLPASWMLGSAVEVGDDVRIVASGTNHSFIAPPINAPTKVTIMTRVIVEQTTGNNDADFGVSVPYNPSNDDAIRCELYSPTAQQTANRDISLWDSIRSTEVGSHQFAWVTGTPYLITLQRADTNYTCLASALSGTPVMASGTTTSLPAQQKFALRTYATSTLISYVLIVANP